MTGTIPEKGWKILLYAGNSEYPTVPKGENPLVRTISREVPNKLVGDPSTTTRRILHASEGVI